MGQISIQAKLKAMKLGHYVFVTLFKHNLCLRDLTLTVLVTTILMHWDIFRQDNYSTVGGDAYGGCRGGEVRAGTTSPMPDHKGVNLFMTMSTQLLLVPWMVS